MFLIRLNETGTYCYDPDWFVDPADLLGMTDEELAEDARVYQENGKFYFRDQPRLEFETSLDAENYLSTSDFFVPRDDFTIVEVN